MDWNLRIISRVRMVKQTDTVKRITVFALGERIISLGRGSEKRVRSPSEDGHGGPPQLRSFDYREVACISS
jgi:hypothetical protein